MAGLRAGWDDCATCATVGVGRSDCCRHEGFALRWLLLFVRYWGSGEVDAIRHSGGGMVHWLLRPA
jgi:hypothetical protein